MEADNFRKIETKPKRMPLSQSEPESNVYMDGRYVFHVFTGQKAVVLSYLQKHGILDKLVAMQMIPEIVDFKVSQGSETRIVIKQPLLTISYPPEWTQYMVSTAGLRLLELVRTLDAFDAGIIDFHPFNIVFVGNNPQFVDMGSFILKNDQRDLLFNQPEFYNYFILPKKLAKKGYREIQNSVFNQTLPSTELFNDLKRVDSGINGNFLYRFLSQRLQRLLNEMILNPLPLALVQGKFAFFKKFFIQTIGQPRGRRALNRCFNGFASELMFCEQKSEWGNYDVDYYFTHRFNSIVRLIENHKPCSLLDIGGNSGYLFGELLASEIKFEKYILLDVDSDSVDKAFIRYGHDSRFTVAKFDFADPWENFEVIPFQTRFNSEMVLALAITHHLLLTYKMPIDTMLQRFYELTSEMLLIEFMPLGLWNGSNVKIESPSWYTRQFFESHILHFFEIKEVLELETNRILFVCKKLKESLEDNPQSNFRE